MPELGCPLTHPVLPLVLDLPEEDPVVILDQLETLAQ